MYRECCDICRYVNCGLLIIILMLLQRAMHLESSTWTHKTRDLHRFLTLLCITILLGTMEKLYQHDQPAVVVFFQTGVLILGAHAIWRKEPLMRGIKKDSDPDHHEDSEQG